MVGWTRGSEVVALTWVCAQLITFPLKIWIKKGQNSYRTLIIKINNGMPILNFPNKKM